MDDLQAKKQFVVSAEEQRKAEKCDLVSYPFHLTFPEDMPPKHVFFTLTATVSQKQWWFLKSETFAPCSDAT